MFLTLARLTGRLWFRGLQFVQKIAGPRQRIRWPRRFRLFRDRFIRGLNLPWFDYGNDFGANAWSPNGGVAQAKKRAKMQTVFRSLQEQNVQVVRWFLLADGRAGIRYAEDGTPIGLDDRIFADLDAAVEVAGEYGLQVIFVLLDFLWFGPAALKNGVQVRGRTHIVADRRKCRALLHRVLKPILKRYGRSPAIFAWDVMNEPEWATLGFGSHHPETDLPPWRMRRFLGKLVRLVHRHARQPTTCGLANAGGLALVRSIGLDLYQVHWYDRFQESAPLERPAREWQINRPLLLGEFPTRNSARSPDAILAQARQSGYCGALAWSLLAEDNSSGLDNPQA